MATDKIKQLLVASGVSDELAARIVESMVEYKATCVAEAKTTLDEKIKLAKEVIFEEVELYKQELARKVQMFCESKVQTIDQQLKRKSAAGETEATAKLTKVYALLEGINLEGNKPDSKLEAQIADANSRIALLSKNLVSAKTQAKRAIEIAESVMAKNKLLITENRKISNKEALVTESRVRGNTANKAVIVPARNKHVVESQINESTDSILVKPKSGAINQPSKSTSKNASVVGNPIDTIAGLMN